MKQEWVIDTNLPINYEIKISNDLLNPENKDILRYGDQIYGRRRLVFLDRNVHKYYGEKVKKYFEYNNISYHIVLIDGGETVKSLDNLLYSLGEIEQFGLSRKNEPIIVIGGGVVLDIVGLASSLYRRGIPYIRIPTTLLGIVDVSVAAKTGINFLNRRNRLGAYYPPISTLLDKTFIKTLEHIEISSGMGEILKMAVVKDYNLFKLLENYGDKLYEYKFEHESAEEVISLSIEGMKVELENNLWEKDLKRLVDFGHSFSPIIEMRSLIDNKVDSLTHGYAVTLDVIFSCVISYLRGMLPYSELMRVINTAKKMGIPTYHPFFTNSLLLLESLNDVVKHRNGDQNLPIPVKIGESIFINDITHDEIKKSVELFIKINEDVK